MSYAYAGIGSRETPAPILAKMRTLGEELALEGFTLRSGGADGADTAFEHGCNVGKGRKEIFLPWILFNDHNSTLVGVEVKAMEIAHKLIPWWDNLSWASKLLHGRNVYQILGKDLKTPVIQVIYWAPVSSSGEIKGGTRTAVKLAQKYGIDCELLTE